MELITLPWSSLLLFVPVIVFAGLVHGALGLGFPMVATPVIALFVDVRVAIFITLLPTVMVNLASVGANKNVQFVVVRYLPMALAAMLGSAIGSAILAISNAEVFRLLLAMLILAFLWTQHQKKLPDQWLRINQLALLIMVGLLAGFAGGTTNVMVAILLIYFLSAQVARAEMITAMNLCFLLGKLSQIAVFLFIGAMTLQMLLKTLPLALVALGSLLVGQSISQNIPQQRYQIWLRYFLVILACVLIIQFLMSLIR